MSWRQSLKQGKFRTAAFYIEGHDASGGRRLAQHEYPLRDQPYAEDMGRRAREYSLRCYVLGSDYMPERDILIEALDTYGPGTLVHPYLGTRIVSVDDYRLTETTREGGMAVFSIRFVESGELRYPVEGTDTTTAVQAAMLASQVASTQWLSSNFNVIGMIDDYVAEVLASIESGLAVVTNVVGDISGGIANVIRAPAELGALIIGSINEVQALISEPKNALAVYQALAGSDNTGILSTATPQRLQQAQAMSATNTFVRQIALTEAIGIASTIDYDTSEDASKVSAQLQDLLDKQMLEMMDDAVYQTFRTLRTTMVNDLRERGARLPSLKRLILDAAQPSLVLAHQLYNDVNRADEIVSRNNVRHPGFVPGGKELEVLNV